MQDRRSGVAPQSVTSGPRSDVPPRSRTYSTNWLSPASFGVWGGSPGNRARLAWALASRIDPTPLWLQVELPSGEKDPEEHEVVNRVPVEGRYFVNPADLAPPAELGNAATWFLRDGVEAGVRLSTLADVVRLPLLAQRLLEGRSVYSSTKALVIANSDRLQPMYPTTEGGIRPFIEAFHEFAASVIFTITTPPMANARDVDYLLRLDGGTSNPRGPVRVVVQFGAPSGVPGLFKAGTERPYLAMLDEIQKS